MRHAVCTRSDAEGILRLLVRLLHALAHRRTDGAVRLADGGAERSSYRLTSCVSQRLAERIPERGTVCPAHRVSKRVSERDAHWLPDRGRCDAVAKRGTEPVAEPVAECFAVSVANNHTIRVAEHLADRVPDGIWRHSIAHRLAHLWPSGAG